MEPAALPDTFREALLRVPPAERDAWVDRTFGLDALPDDGPALPAGCVPYLPCAVDAVLRMVQHAPVRASDVFVDVGAGVGRVLALVHLLSGARAVGVEIQPQLVGAARALALRLRTPQVSCIAGDAVERLPDVREGTVFFLYCPFSGARLAAVIDELRAIAATRTIRVCTVDVPLPPCPWLAREHAPGAELEIYRSTLM